MNNTFVYEDENGVIKHIRVDREGGSFVSGAENFTWYLPRGAGDGLLQDAKNELARDKDCMRMFRNQSNFMEIVLAQYKTEANELERMERERNRKLADYLSEAWNGFGHPEASKEAWLNIAKAARDFIEEENDDASL